MALEYCGISSVFHLFSYDLTFVQVAAVLCLFKSKMQSGICLKTWQYLQQSTFHHVAVSHMTRFHCERMLVMQDWGASGIYREKTTDYKMHIFKARHLIIRIKVDFNLKIIFLMRPYVQMQVNWREKLSFNMSDDPMKVSGGFTREVIMLRLAGWTNMTSSAELKTTH